MAEPKVSEVEFVRLFRELGGAPLARKLGCTTRKVFERRRSIEKRLGVTIEPPIQNLFHNPKAERVNYPQRKNLELRDGTVFVASDFHYWPGEPSVIHRAIIHLIKEIKPLGLIANGDVMDASKVSRHPPIGWQDRPDLVEEVETAQNRLHEIRQALSRKARTIWTLGNHDARFETRLATVAPEYAKISGVHLHDHFPLWETAWSVWVNESVVIKHRFKGGIHAVHNNALWAGKTIITGHLHSAKVTPLSDYNGTRYGVDTGCVADVDHKAFIDYTEDNPKNWRSAFCVLTFVDGKLLCPELVLKVDNDSVEFRGRIIRV